MIWTIYLEQECLLGYFGCKIKGFNYRFHNTKGYWQAYGSFSWFSLVYFLVCGYLQYSVTSSQLLKLLEFQHFSFDLLIMNCSIIAISQLNLWFYIRLCCFRSSIFLLQYWSRYVRKLCFSFTWPISFTYFKIYCSFR